MRILHLSDLHFGMEKCKKLTEDDIAARENCLDEVLDKLQEIVNQKSIDYIFITGDIAFSAQREEYEKAKEWINKLVDICKIKRDSLFLCPGNHDVDRSELEDKEVPNNQERTNKLLSTKNFVKISERFKEYILFCKDIGVSSYNLGGDTNYLVGMVEKIDINVMCINTAWFAKNDKYEKNMWVGANFIERIKNDKIFCNNRPVFTIMHHPDSWWNEQERGNYDGITNVYTEICKLSNVILLGHTHEIKNDHIYKEDAYICGSGAVFEGRTYRHNFHVYDIGDNTSSEHNSYKTIYKYSSGDWDKQEKDIDINIKCKLKGGGSNIKAKVSLINDNVLERLESEISSKFIDLTVQEVEKDSDKLVLLEETICRFIKTNDEFIDFNTVLEKMKKGTGKKKVGLTIQGFEGTGKSTFLSLLYLKLKEMKLTGEVTQYPILIDLHYYDKFELIEAKNDLQSKLSLIDLLINEHQIQLFLIFDGCDDYTRKNNELELVLAEYIKKNQEKFILCIGNANEIEKSRSTYRSPLHQFNTRLKLQSVSLDSTECLIPILDNLAKIFDVKSDKEREKKIVQCFKDSSVKRVDFRTLIMCAKTEMNDIPTNKLTLGSILHKYLINEVGDMERLYEISRLSTIYTITEENISIDKYNLDGIEVIYKGKIVREFMVAYYFMQTIMKKYNKSDADYKRLCSIPFVFTPIINKFGKEMLINSSAIDQLNIVRNLIDMYNDVNITMSMKDQICYFLGRVGRQKAKNKAGYFLEEQAIELEKKIYFNEECERDEEELQMLLVLYRTISVSLVIMDNIKYIEEYINHLIYDDNLNSINRGFHIEYYSDKEYRLGESPDYFDDTNYHVDNTLSFLINVIKGKLSYDKFTVGCSIYLDIITLFSIYISRISEPDICDKYTEQVKGIADMISKSVKILDPTITNYVLMVQEVINSEKKPYKHFMDEMSRLKSTKRSGWIIRGIQNPESIADHILGTVYLANHFLPDNINEFKEYKGIGDIKKYKNSYDKEKIIKMLLIHDMGEANVGDHIDKSEEISNKENVRFSYYAMLCTLPKIHGMNINKDYWDEFFKQDTINAQIAYDIDKLEALIQAYNYKREGQDIKLDEWIISVRSNMKTSLGDALLQFFVKEIIDK